jgi:phosphoglycerate dehydrogenase-like enzyme
MKTVVHLVDPSDQLFRDLLRPLLHDGVALHWGPDIRPEHDIEILVFGVPERKHLDLCPHLKALVIPWSGLPGRTRELLSEYPQIAVHNLHHNAAAVAEAAVTLMLCAAKGTVNHDRKLRRGDWRPRYADPDMLLLQGKTALVLGYGAIGSRIAALCLGLGLNVHAVRRTGRPDRAGLITVHPPDDLQRLLPRTQVLFVTVPLTDATKGFIGRRELSLLPAGAILVNVARGRIVDEAALYETLHEKRISAGLDVWYRYPESAELRSHTPPSAFPFGNLDNVVMTPHLAEHTRDTERLRAEALAATLNAAAQGDPLPNRVDLKLGY